MEDVQCRLNSRNNLYRLFIALMCFSIACFGMAFLIDPVGDQLNVFFRRTDDLFADFFNVLGYISDRNPYFNPINGFHEKPYLPLSYLLLYPFSTLDNFDQMSLQEAWDSKAGFYSIISFSVLSSILFLISVWGLLNKNKYRLLMFLCLLFSSLFIYTLERGNWILITIACVLFFLSSYESQVKWKRFAGYTALCLAVTLKVYPILFGLLLLKKREYKAICYCAIVTAFMVFLPFLFFENGLNNIPQLLSNQMQNGQIYSVLGMQLGVKKLIITLENIFPNFPDISRSLLSLIEWSLCILSFFFLFVVRQEWLKVLLIALLVIVLPANSGYYCAMYLIPAVIFFFNEKGESRPTPFLLLMTFFLFVLLSPFQFVIHFGEQDTIALTPLLANLSILSIWIVALIYGVNYFIRRKASKIVEIE